jgi:hypothetical protein
MHLKGKFPLKSNQDILAMVNERTTRFLQEEEWVDIVRYMYNDVDS